MKIFGGHNLIPRAPFFWRSQHTTRVSVNLLSPKNQSCFKKSEPHPAPFLITPAPLAHKGIFSRSARIIQKLLSKNEQPPFALDFPREASTHTRGENGRVHVIMVMADEDYIRWQAKEPACWNEIKKEDQHHLINKYGLKKNHSWQTDKITYTLVARSLLVPTTSRSLVHKTSHPRKSHLTPKNWPNLIKSLAFLAMWGTAFKARPVWHKGRFHFVMFPGCPFGVDPRDPDIEKHLGQDNRYYQLFRRCSGVVNRTDLDTILGNNTSLGKELWQHLIKNNLITPYKDHQDEATVNNLVTSNPSQSEKIILEIGTDATTAFLVVQLLTSFHEQRKHRPKIIDQSIVPNPLVVMTYDWRLRLAEHHRVFGAMSFGIPIAINLSFDEKLSLN